MERMSLTVDDIIYEGRTADDVHFSEEKTAQSQEMVRRKPTLVLVKTLGEKND
jgi:hypothetical protein